VSACLVLLLSNLLVNITSILVCALKVICVVSVASGSIYRNMLFVITLSMRQDVLSGNAKQIAEESWLW
jgi:hypothetical protein